MKINFIKLLNLLADFISKIIWYLLYTTLGPKKKLSSSIKTKKLVEQKLEF